MRLSWALCGLAVLASGCAALDIRADNHRLSGLNELRGTISAEASVDRPIVVLLVREDGPAPRVQSSVVLYRPGVFKVLAERGRYSVFAFSDDNRNLHHDAGEASGRYARQVQVEDNEAVRGIDIALAVSDQPLPVVWQPRHDELVDGISERTFPKAVGAKGMWAPGHFLALNGDDALLLLEPFDPAKLPVVIVHGIGGTPQDLKPMVDKLDRSRFQPWLFHYASGKRLASSGQSLKRALDEMRVLHDFSSIVVVAQSVGGMVAREAVQQLQHGEHRFEVAALLTLSTPWRGHSKANLGITSNFLVLPAWHDIVPESDFQRAQIGTAIPAVKHYLFFSYGRDGQGDGSVALGSELDLMMQKRAVEVIGFPETHMGIVTNAESQQRFVEVMSAVRAQVAEAP